MTVRYTAIDSMEEAALRDVDRNAERWRDKIEVRLDNRQVFFLFFGSAVVACMLFVLGVMVGKRIESRGQAAAPELQNPLDALDRAQTPAATVVPPTPPLTFPNTLIAPSARAPKPAKLAAVMPAPAPKPAPVAAPAPAPKPAPVAAAPKPIAIAATSQPPKPIAPAAMPQKPTAATAPATDSAKGKGKFTLHLSTFTTATEAKAFAEQYPGAFVVAGDVPGRGMSYRVRYGNFPTYKDATSAKDSFEKQHGTIALVAAR
jgi:hypothetical protein